MRSFKLMVMGLIFSNIGLAFVLTGDGHFSLEGEYRSKPAHVQGGDPIQGVRHNLRLGLEAVVDDKLSGMFELRLTDSLRDSYLGDTPQSPEEQANCNPATSNAQCPRRSPLDNSKESFKPRLAKAYIRAAYEYCILEAGRRGRDWGLGMYLDSGTGPYERDASIFDGIDCSLNIDKFQTLSFRLGYDKLQETDYASGTAASGIANKKDDINQFFFSMMVDERETKKSAFFKKNIGVYVAYILGKNFDTDIKIADLYIDLTFGRFNWKNEILFRLGESSNPALSASGGYAPANVIGNGGALANLKKNKLDATAFAGKFFYQISESGKLEAPKEYAQNSDYRSHSIYSEYAIVPGDKDGYKSPENRDSELEAIKLHRNFKPALILFNAPSAVDVVNKDGIADSDRITNALVYSLGYRYENLKLGNFDCKLIGAKLMESLPTADRANQSGIGFNSDDLGFEVDIAYEYRINPRAVFGLNVGYLAAGDAWQKNAVEKAEDTFLLQTNINFQF